MKLSAKQLAGFIENNTPKVAWEMDKPFYEAVLRGAPDNNGASIASIRGIKIRIVKERCFRLVYVFPCGKVVSFNAPTSNI